MAVEYRVESGETRRIIGDVVREADGYWEYRRTVASLFEAFRRIQDLGPLTASLVDEARDKCERDLFGLQWAIAYPAHAVLESVSGLEGADGEMADRAGAAGAAGAAVGAMGSVSAAGVRGTGGDAHV